MAVSIHISTISKLSLTFVKMKSLKMCLFMPLQMEETRTQKAAWVLLKDVAIAFKKNRWKNCFS